MSKNGKQPFLRKDFTLQDYADTTPGRFSGLRLKKGVISKKVNKKEVDKMANQEDVSWFDKDLDDFDVTMTNEENTINDSEDEADQMKKPILRRKQRQRTISSEDNGIIYPTDLWLQLSFCIYPESIGVFAQLCRGTRAVVQTVLFWKSLYLRFYKEKKNIPEKYGLSSIECIHGLRARTIKMLYCGYQPFIDRTLTTVPFENEPHILIGQKCLLSWHNKIKNVWKFYFKFRKGDSVDTSSNKQRSINSNGFLKWHQDLEYNPDAGCSILEVTCQTFVQLPVVMGLILNGVYLNVSHGSMRYHRLKLILDSNFHTISTKNQMSMYELILDPILEVRVYPWWHPSFTDTQSVLLCDD
ncbi:hypothetical protein ACF0H5_016273 [Mactra antiquata]